MVNDSNSILLGLYREASFTRTIEESCDFSKKELFFDSKHYTIIEERVDGKLVWKVFDENRELNIDSIINIYAEHNLRRLMRAYLPNKITQKLN
jgi:hypothetical protein